MKKRAYFKMMKCFGITPHVRENVQFVKIEVLDPIDSKNGIQLGQSFEIIETLDGAFRIRVPFRDFPYPIPAENVKVILVRKKRVRRLTQVA